MTGIGKEFMRKTRFDYLEPSDQVRGIPTPPLELPLTGGGRVTNLPDPSTIHVRKIDLRDAIEQRKSSRHYDPDPLSIEELAFLLWCTQGVKENVRDQFTFRIVPSAGARHAFETYLLVNSVEGLTPGLYRYLALEHALAEVSRDPQIFEQLTRGCLNQRNVREDSVTFFWVAVAHRMTWRYGERGYRYLHIDAGHVCQNLYLAAQAVKCGVCAIGAFHDEEMNDILNLDGEEQFLIYMATVGKINE